MSDLMIAWLIGYVVAGLLVAAFVLGMCTGKPVGTLKAVYLMAICGLFWPVFLVVGIVRGRGLT